MVEIEGKVMQLGEVEYKGANNLAIQALAIEVEGQYPETWVIKAFGEKTQYLGQLAAGDKVKLRVAGNGRVYNGNWYMDLRLISCYHLRDAPTPVQEASPVAQQEPIKQEAESSDLPF
jgi:Domain of unknown function (DUF3127)